DLSMWEGSHHFDVYAFDCQDLDRNGVNDCDEAGFDARFPDGFRPCEDFVSLYPASPLAGTIVPETVIDFDTTHTGPAQALHRNQPRLLNSHFLNSYVHTEAAGWVNIWPVSREFVRHPLSIFLETFAYRLIKVPPGSERPVTWYACSFASCPEAGVSPWVPTPSADRFMLLGVS